MAGLIILSLAFVLVFGTMAWAIFSAAPWVPAFKKDLLVAIRQADIKPGEIVCDLGCGDGRFLLLAARNTPARKVIGYEISFLPWLMSLVAALFSGALKRISVKFANFFTTDLSKADVVYCFLTPPAMKKLEPKLKKELKSGARLISYSFKLPNTPADKIVRKNEKSLPFFIYRF